MDITNDGTIHIDGAPIGQIDIVRFEELNYLQKTGRNLFAAVGVLPEVPENPAIVQGFVETSNVNPIIEMVNMIEALRAFEMYQKLVHTYDSLNEQASNIIGRAT
jgi:flagellar basal-body rod protein FlgG